MEVLPSSPSQGFYFTHYQMFSSVELSPFIQPCESQHRSYFTGGWEGLALPVSKKNEGEKGGLGESLMTPQSITQENGQYKVLKWTNKLELFKKYACKSRTYFYLHSFSWPLFPNRYPCQRRALELGVCLT